MYMQNKQIHDKECCIGTFKKKWKTISKKDAVQ